MATKVNRSLIQLIENISYMTVGGPNGLLNLGNFEVIFYSV
jgi:hypothetical protein